MKIKIKLMEMYVNTVMDREEYIVENIRNVKCNCKRY